MMSRAVPRARARTRVARALRVAGMLAVAAARGPMAEAQQAPLPHGRVVTESFWSQSLGANKSVVVYLPPSYDAQPSKRYPVAYYLHGAFGDETNWSTVGKLPLAMDSLVAHGTPEMIVVMPDGDDGWYTTWNVLITADQCKSARYSRENPATYCVPWGHYDDYIAHDLVQWTDGRYRTLADRAHRGIAGLSMGGYGAITLALGYPEQFAVAASHSGVLSPLYVGPHPFSAPPRYAVGAAPEVEAAWSKSLLTVPAVFGRDSASWWSRDPAQKLRRLKASGKPIPALFVDAGTEDALYVDQSRAFHWEAERVGVPISYHEWPGSHDWAYWRAHVGESLSFLAGVIAQ